MSESLNRRTTSLPDLKGDHQCDNLTIGQRGINTKLSFHQDVISTQVSTINAAVKSVSQNTLEPPLVILTGGEVKLLIRHLPSTNQPIPDLVLRGTDA